MPNVTLSPRAQAKREQILSAARSLFLTQGYARTSMDAITQGAGVSKQTLYAYFASKAELIAAVVTQEIDGLEGSSAHAPIRTLPELRATLFGFARTLTGRLMQEEAVALLRLLIGEAVHVPELRQLLRGAFPVRLLTQAEALLEAAHHQEIIQAPDPAVSARMFVGPIMSFVMLDGLLSESTATPPSDAVLMKIVEAFLRTVPREAQEGDLT